MIRLQPQMRAMALPLSDFLFILRPYTAIFFPAIAVIANAGIASRVVMDSCLANTRSAARLPAPERAHRGVSLFPESRAW